MNREQPESLCIALEEALSLCLFSYICFNLKVQAQTEKMSRVLKLTFLREQGRFKLLGTGDYLGKTKTAERRGTCS